MTPTLLDPFAPLLAGLFLKATLVMAITLALHLGTQRWASASSRHLITLTAVVMLLALPLLAVFGPRWTLPVPGPLADLVATEAPLAVYTAFDDVAEPESARAASVAVAVDAPARVATPSPNAGPGDPIARVRWSAVMVALYLGGVCVMGAHLLVQRWRVHRLAREACPVTDRAWLALVDDCARILGGRRSIRLLRSRRSAMPMTFGTLRPAVLLPATADLWPDDRRRAVMLHELGHVVRFDCLTQWGACLMRAVYWCHPGAWWLVGRLQAEREFACDDLVLASGAEAHEYAGHLLEIAHGYGGGRAPALAVRMARRSQIEGRLRALLDVTRRRGGPSRSARLATTASAFAVLLPLAGATPPMAPTPSPEPGIARGIAGRATPSPAPLPVAAPRVAVSPAHATAPVAPVALAQPTPASSASEGCTWDLGAGKDGLVHLSMRFGRSQSGRSVPMAQLEGLTAAQLAAGGPVRFVVRRDAGTFTFDGVARAGAAAGVCTFAASPTFGAELGKRGITGLTPADQEQMARHDVGLALVDELRTQKYATPSVAELVKAGQHGVQVDYVRGMGALGYATGALPALITLRDHGVTPAYAEALASFGYARLPLEVLQRARDHGVTPDYVKGMREAGHGTLTLEQLITTRDHGVTPEFGRALQAAGYPNLPLDQLVRVRDHGITAGYLTEMKALGISGPLETLVNARDHGITPSYIRDMNALGVTGPLDTLVRLRDHGVTPSFVKDLQAIGYTGVATDDLVRLRDHGLTASRITQANTRAGSRQSVETLVDNARRGR